MDNWLALFDGQTRYFLDIFDSSVKPDVLRFYGREALSEPFSWDIEFTTLQANIPPEEVLMKYASFRMRSGKSVHGMVTRLEWLSTSKDQSHYRLTISSRLALLGYTRQCVVYQNQSVPEVVEQVLRKHGLEGPDFEFRLERTYPPREIITQWRETDLQFIQRILSEVGIYWRTEMDDVRGLDTYILADSQLNYQFDVQLPYSEPSGLFDSVAESVWDVRTWHNIATGTVTTRDYNYRTATMPMNAAVSVRNDVVTTGEHYRYAAPYREAGDDASPEPETESGAFWARLHHERELNRSARIHLFSNAAHLTPGQVLEPQGDVITALQEGVILTLVTFRGARDSRLHVSVWGQPYTERYCFRPAEIPRPVIAGTLPARIESREKNDTYAHLDEQGRYRVKQDFDREGTEPGYGYLWLRMAKPYAGETLGWHTPLIDGTEVAIAYSNGDIDLPYIACALHDSEHPDLVNRDNHTRNILRTPANSKLRMEDKRGEEHIKLATEYGKTQLNNGHLVNSKGQLRGKGTELRTDEWGVLRAGKGLFVAADVQAKAQGDALDMDAALKEIDRLNQQLQQLEMAAEKALALKGDVDSQIQMFEQRLKPLNEAVLFSAPEGMALTSGEDMQLAAGRNLALNAGEDFSAGVMGNATALTGEKLGLFARTGQLSLKSGEGPIDVQAQNASMRLFAEKKLTLSSASDISFAGKKRITLIGGGSYLKLEAGKVEYGTTASYVRKVKRTMAASASAKPPEALSLPPPATMREFNPETLTPWVTPVYAKSCLKEKGCTDAGTAEEPVDNFGQMTIFAQPVEDDCCGYGHQHEHADDEVVQHAQSAKKRKPDAGGAQATAAPLALGAATGVMTQVWGEWSLTGVLGAARGIPYVGAMMSALYVPSAGEGSDRVPGRDEFWYEEELRQKAITGAKATTRVRFFWRQDEQGNMRVYGVHTGEGTPYEGVRTANMVWNSEHNQYEFTPAHGADGPLITWTPERPEGSDLPSHTGSDIKPIDQATILVTPIPDGKDEYTTPPFPVPEERDLNDYILVFPADSGIKPIYVYLKTARDEPGVATGKGETLSGSEKWLEAASSGLGAPVPAQVADKLRGKPFRNFDHFREEFWLAVAECPELMSQFKRVNQMEIRDGNAPFSIVPEQVGGRKRFEIHHIERIIDSGAVYDFENMRVNTVRNHINLHSKKNR
ncbi:type VI secretion system tip protein VgrG [Escherichia sp. E2586]|nr:type VI secretion system tip protein VgrG [Escherichia sp. E1V33]RZM91980.1 type VI secretion system tip protein VgrG [Escherichia sp. E14V5]RZN00724.1 type VI secretion system tip protein VgrG [Escherichia sp. E14V7]RZN16940.1 type VI secretion system tip protein VgrG [Escherichia sp. E14S1]RZN23682.1 type VI secretion system tip protein VgrG [Escherichia sp. E14V10]TBR63459.1 type VI secretion system tip protein VgrG [Escherichia sp. E10V4]TBR63472.1 type VI secretion system tip protein 